MTASEETKEKAAAVGFAAVLTMLAGPVGLFVAAVAIAAERAWNGDGGATAGREAGRQNVADHRAWLARDAAQRAAWRQARRDWWKAGADPDMRPATPSAGARFGTWCRRMWARAAVFGDDFRTEFRRTRAAQRDATARGASPWKAAKARPDHPDADRLDWSQFEEPKPQSRPEPKPEPEPTGEPAPDAEPDTPQPKPEPAPQPQPQEQPEPHPDHQEEPMTAAGTAQQGEANHVYVTQNLDRIRGFQGRIDELVDAANQERQQLMTETTAAAEHARATGQPAATLQALDEALAYLKAMGRSLSAFAAGNAATAEQVGAADTGLDPARQADDTLRAAGADGRAVAPGGASAPGGGLGPPGSYEGYLDERYAGRGHGEPWSQR